MIDVMDEARRARAALSAILIVLFGGAPLIAVSVRTFHYGLGVAVAFFAALPVVAVSTAVKVLETDAE